MLFERLKYILPVWYYNLIPGKKIPYFVDIYKIKNSLLNEKVDKTYKSREFALVDKAYELFRSGYISTNEEEALRTESSLFPVEDEYGFIKKHFGKLYTYYIFILRVFSGSAIRTELKGLFGSRKFSKMKSLHCKVGLTNIDSYILKDTPFASIILPTLNRYKFLMNVLKDLEKQTYTKFEVIIVDQSDDYNPEFYNNFHNLNLKTIHIKKKGVWNARNYGIREAAGGVILFTEDDVRVPEEWLESHLKCLEYFKCDISSGLLVDAEEHIEERQPVFKWSEQLPTGNVAIKKLVFKSVGLFDLQFERQRMGDGEFGLRSYLNGFKNISNPAAYCIDIKADTGGFREFGAWDAYRTKKIFGPRPVPSVLYFYRKYFNRELTLLALLKNIPPSIIPYEFKRNRRLLIAGSFSIIFFIPLVIFQVALSWRLASNKLKEGAKIEQL
jgi:glycosyltransferase involved in cell wall biosynthesis